MSSEKPFQNKEISLDYFFESIKDEVIPLKMVPGDYVILEDVHLENLRESRRGNRVVDVVGRVIDTNMGIPEGQMIRFTLSVANALEVAHHIKSGIRYTLIKKSEMRINVSGYNEIPKRI